MKTKHILVSVLVVTVLVASTAIISLTGCTTGGAIAADLQPVSVSVNSQQGIWVSGQGKVTVTPDIATLNLGVSAQASSVADAQHQAASAMDKIMAALTSNGINKQDVKTQYFSIQPTYRYDEVKGQSTITGYSVSNVVTVKIKSVEKTGTIIDAVVDAGGDNTVMNGISFSAEEPEQYYDEARQLAMEDARAKAEELARLAGVALGKATSITESNYTPYPQYPVEFAKGLDASYPTTPISPGEMDIVLNVQVAYAIQ